jgi:hypothetical protein
MFHTCIIQEIFEEEEMDFAQWDWKRYVVPSNLFGC